MQLVCKSGRVNLPEEVLHAISKVFVSCRVDERVVADAGHGEPVSGEKDLRVV